MPAPKGCNFRTGSSCGSSRTSSACTAASWQWGATRKPRKIRCPFTAITCSFVCVRLGILSVGARAVRVASTPSVFYQRVFGPRDAKVAFEPQLIKPDRRCRAQEGASPTCVPAFFGAPPTVSPGGVWAARRKLRRAFCGRQRASHPGSHREPVISAGCPKAAKSYAASGVPQVAKSFAAFGVP